MLPACQQHVHVHVQIHKMILFATSIHSVYLNNALEALLRAPKISRPWGIYKILKL